MTLDGTTSVIISVATVVTALVSFMFFRFQKRMAARNNPVVHTSPRRSFSRSGNKLFVLNYALDEQHTNAWEITSVEVTSPKRKNLLALPATNPNQYGENTVLRADQFRSRLDLPEERCLKGMLVISSDAPESLVLTFTISHLASDISASCFSKRITIND